MNARANHFGALPELLADVTARVLEEAAFLITKPAPDQPLDARELCQTSIAFVGAKSGLLRLITSKERLRLLTADMLGVEPDAEASSLNENAALNELAHLVACALVSQLPGGSALCRLDLPRGDMVSF